MRTKLDEVEARYEELNRRLAEPGTQGQPSLVRELSREHHQLEQVVLSYRKQRQVQRELAATRELLAQAQDPELMGLAKEELLLLQQQDDELDDTIKKLLLPKDKNDSKNVVLEIRSGTGGDEAALFCGELFRMYARLAEAHGWRCDILSSSTGSVGGFKEVIALLEGRDVYATLKYESGVHRVQRVPATEAQGRVHTSAVTVAVLPEAEEIDVDIHEHELRIDVYRSSGPGGQSVNTTDSAVRITHLPTGLVVTCQDEKSQLKNKAKGLKVLRARLLDKMQAEQHAAMAAERRSMVKTGDRSEKVRTYNVPQDRLTDHRIGLTIHNLPRVFAGHLDEVITALRHHYQAKALAGHKKGAASGSVYP